MDQIGKYIVLEEIGHGGMGIVYKARDPIIGREVAVKVIIERVMRSPDLKGRFLREIASAGRLSHENIMTIYDAGDHEGRPYFVMELLSGTDLSTVIRHRTLALDEKLGIALQVARGLRYAHDRGVIHRDIKPDNVRVLDSGRAKVMDFGIARVESATHTPTHSSIGTPRYMSPEQIKGEHVDRRTDIFSFGALLYELLTGTPPFSGERITTVIYKILHENPAPMDLGEVPGAEDLCRVVERCLKKDLDERYSAFDEVLADLEAVAAQQRAVTPTVTIRRADTEERAPQGTGDGVLGPPVKNEPLVSKPTRGVPPTDPQFSPPGTAHDETVLEPLTAAGRPAARASKRKIPSIKARPVRSLVIGGIGLLAVAGLAYMIGQPDEEPEASFLATADSSVVQSGVPSMAVDSAEAVPDVGEALDGAEPVDEEAVEEAPSEESAAMVEGVQQAEAARAQMRSAKARADRAEAPADATALYGRAVAQERTGDAAFRRGDASGYTAAQSAYAEAGRLYDQARRAAGQRQEAEEAQTAMVQARATVVDRRADPRITAVFQQAEARRTAAERHLRDGEFEQAVASFGEARTLYADAAQTASRPVPVAEVTPPVAEPEPSPPQPSPEERAQAAAERAAESVAARLKQALEQEDTSAMRAVNSTYDGWDGFFRLAENVRATVSVNTVEVSGDRATAAVDLRIRFRNTSKNSDESTNVQYTWALEQRGTSWTLASVATR